MKKRIISTAIAALLLLGLLPGASAASGSLSNFTRSHTYQTGRFTDVASSDWYAAYVQAAYEYGLVDGKAASAFLPDDFLTVAEALKLAVCLHDIYYTGSAAVSNGTGADPWYGPYADAALAAGIADAAGYDYNAPATRAQFALFLSGALPDEALAPINDVEDGAIPDVPPGLAYSGAVYGLYRAGVLTGSDDRGSFLPDSTITRAEVAAIVTRMADPAFRGHIDLERDLSVTQIFEKCGPAVFYIEISDIKGTLVKTGSGFFIGESGLAVTNYHVIVGAASAAVTTLDGKKYEVTGLYGYDEALDLALIQVGGAGFKALELADSDSVAVGADAYAIGSPLGYKNTISAGIVSGVGRLVDGRFFIQTTAAISPGSSGGVLLSGSGRVIGVTTATAAGAQNINLAVPSNNILKLDRTTFATLSSVLPDTRFYDDHFPVPDFGASSGAAVYKTDKELTDTYVYYYKLEDVQKDKKLDDVYADYAGLLEQNTFSFYGYAIEEGKIISYYLNGSYQLLVTYGEKAVDGVECVRVQIMVL